jgi:hypothetical protein
MAATSLKTFLGMHAVTMLAKAESKPSGATLTSTCVDLDDDQTSLFTARLTWEQC